MFLVEDGTVVEGANSYVAVAFADAYHTDRGNTAWTGTDAVKQAALIKATDYLQQLYNGRWVGWLVDDDQPLDWPRTYNRPAYPWVDYDITGEIPDRLKQAVCILALESLSNDLNPALDRAVKREKVDVIEVEYMDGAAERRKRPAVDGLVRPYLQGSSLNAWAVRV
jgi:hypothetical protein